MTEPFQSLSPATAADVAWASAAVDHYPPYQVGVTIPRGHEAYLRVLPGHDEGRHWQQSYPELLGRPGPDDAPADPRNYQGPDIDDALVDTLVCHLNEATSTGDQCVFALWEGLGYWHRSDSTIAYWSPDAEHGFIHRLVDPVRRRIGARRSRRMLDAHNDRMARMEAFIDSCPVLPAWGGRDMFVVRGPLEAMPSIGAPYFMGDGLNRQVPQLWWPDDHAWTVAQEIDHPWLYVGGSLALIDRLITDERLITVVSHPDDPW